MTKSDIVKVISEETGLPQEEVLAIVDSFMIEIRRSVESGENVYLRGFGSFIIKKRAEKTGRNISTNTTIIIPSHHIPSFKPAKTFIDSVKANTKKIAGGGTDDTGARDEM